MIKNFTFSLLMLASVLSFAQGYDLPVTFDNGSVTYGVVDFGGNSSSVVVDPSDASNMVVKSEKTAAAATWAGTTIGIDQSGTVTSFSAKLPFTVTSTKMSIRVWSPDAGIPVLFKVEDAGDAQKSVETLATTTKANEWETLIFDFSNQRTGTAALNLDYTYNKGSIFFNFDTDGATAGAKTYYWDDVSFVSAGPTKEQINLPVTFDDTMVDYTITSFGDMVSSVVADPKGGMNMVAMSTKPVSSPDWAGVTASTPFGFKDDIPFTATETKMSVRLYSPDANIKVRLKVEDRNVGSKSCEVDVMTTKANEWEVLVFDFSKQVDGTPALDLTTAYGKASLFFNFGVTGAAAGEKTYYWDDLMFGEPDNSSVINTEKATVVFYPNPVNDVLNINTNNPVQKVTVLNAVGSVVETLQPNSTAVNVNMASYTSGMYVVILQTSNETLSFKATKN